MRSGLEPFLPEPENHKTITDCFHAKFSNTSQCHDVQVVEVENSVGTDHSNVAEKVRLEFAAYIES